MKKILLSVIVILLFTLTVYAKGEYNQNSRTILSAVMEKACLGRNNVCFYNFQRRLDNYEKVAGLIYEPCHKQYRGKPEAFADCLYRACREYENQMKQRDKKRPAAKYRNRYKDCEARSNQWKRFNCYEGYFTGKKKDRID